MQNQVTILKHVSFEEHDIGEKYDFGDLNKDFKTLEATGIYPLHDRTKIVEREGGRGKAIRVKYPRGKVRFFESGACWHWKNFGKHQDLYMSYWVKFSDVFDFRAGGKMHGLCGGKCNTGGKKPNGHDGWSSRIHWGKEGKVKQYIYHKDQPGKFGHVIFWRNNPATIVLQEGESKKQLRKPIVRLKRGKWHFVETRVVINNIGEKNGFIQSWLDGKLLLDIYGFEFRDQSCKGDDLLIDNMYFCTFFGGRTDAYKPVKNEYAEFTDFRISKGLYCSPEFDCEKVQPKVVLKKPQPMLFDFEVPNETGKYGYGMRLEWIVPPDVQPAFYQVQFAEEKKGEPGSWITFQSRRDASHGAWANHIGDNIFNQFTKCLDSGKTYFYRMRALDASGHAITGWSNVVSGTTHAYLELMITKVEPKLMSDPVPNADGKYGFGMRIEWLPSVNPKTEFYEIQYTIDGNLAEEKWQVLSSNRSKKHGGWINQIGREVFGEYIRCLPGGQKYWYRVRSLDKNKKPICQWSNILYGINTDYRKVKITRVESHLFDGRIPDGGGRRYGYGMVIKWTPSSHSDRFYYEIRYTTYPSLEVENWNVLDARLRISKGESINHHGNTAFFQMIYGPDKIEEIEYTFCLQSNTTYYYRVRTLNKSGDLLDDWSDIASGKVENYTKGRKRVLPAIK